MEKSMSYEQELTFELRLRGRSDREIADVLREVSSHGVDDEKLREELGSPAEYAAEYEPRKRKTLGARVAAAATFLALGWMLVWVVVALVRRFVLGLDPAMDGVIETWQVIVGALAIAVPGLLAGFLVDFFGPARGRG